MTAPRLDLAADLRKIVRRGASGKNIHSRLLEALNHFPATKRATVREFVLLSVELHAGHDTAVADWFGTAVDVFTNIEYWRREAVGGCDRELQDVVDRALGGWTVWAIPHARTRQPSVMVDRLGETDAQGKARQFREWGGEGNVTFVAVEPGVTPAVAA